MVQTTAVAVLVCASHPVLFRPSTTPPLIFPNRERWSRSSRRADLRQICRSALGTASWRAVECEQRDRRAAWLTAVGLLSFVVIGVALTASIYGACFGIPLLALVGRPWWAATRSVQRHRRLGSTALGNTIVALAVFTAGLVIGVLPGVDDLETPTEVILLAIAVVWLTMCWFATAERVYA